MGTCAPFGFCLFFSARQKQRHKRAKRPVVCWRSAPANARLRWKRCAFGKSLHLRAPLLDFSPEKNEREGQRTIKMKAQLGGARASMPWLTENVNWRTAGPPCGPSRYLCAGSRDARIFPGVCPLPHASSSTAGQRSNYQQASRTISFMTALNSALDECGKWLAFRLFLHLGAHRVSFFLLCLYKYVRV